MADINDPEFNPEATVSVGDSQAGGHPELGVLIEKPADALYRGRSDMGLLQKDLAISDIRFVMPAGMLGNPLATPVLCEEDDALREACPAASRVGEVDALTDILGFLSYPWGGDPFESPIQWDHFPVVGSAYNGVPPKGKHGRIYIVLDGNQSRALMSGEYTDRDGNVVRLGNTYADDVNNTGWEDWPPFEGAQDLSGITVRRLDLTLPPIVITDDVTVTSDFHLRNEISGMPMEFADFHALQRRWSYENWRDNGGWDAPDPGRDLDYDGFVAYSNAYKVDMTIDGRVGAAANKHYLSNPTSCGQKQFNVEFSSWPSRKDPYKEAYKPDSMEGVVEGIVMERSSTSTIEITGCDAVPFTPRFKMELSDYTAGKAADIKMSITQPYGESPVKSMEIQLPEFAINFSSALSPCDRSLPVEQCGPDSVLGKIEVDTAFTESPLSGKLYLRSADSEDRFGLTLDIKGTVGKGDIEAKVEGSVELGKQSSAGTVSVKTAIGAGQIPEVPLTGMFLTLEGGDKGAFKNPDVCKPQTYSAKFESFSGKVVKREGSYEITGCGDPKLDVELSNRRVGALTDLDINLRPSGKRLRSVELRLPRQLHWGRRKHYRVPKKIRLKSVGTVAFDTAGGRKKIRLIARHTKRGNLRFKPLKRKPKGAKAATSQVPGFSATLFRTGDRSRSSRKKTAKRERKRNAKMDIKSASFTFSGLPQDDLTGVELSLRGRDGRRKFYLRNPIGCGKRLNFTATVTALDGSRLAVKDQVRLRGRSCKRRRKKVDMNIVRMGR